MKLDSARVLDVFASVATDSFMNYLMLYVGDGFDTSFVFCFMFSFLKLIDLFDSWFSLV